MLLPIAVQACRTAGTPPGRSVVRAPGRPGAAPLGLALAAMLLLSLGPLLSQLWLPLQPAWLSELACAEGEAGQAPQPGHEALWAKCGYCTLLLNSPALTRPAAQLVAAGLLRQRPGLPARPRGARALWSYPGAYGRAPPGFS